MAVIGECVRHLPHSSPDAQMETRYEKQCSSNVSNNNVYIYMLVPLISYGENTFYKLIWFTFLL